MSVTKYPQKYKQLLHALRQGKQQSIAEICGFFTAIREEIESNRHLADLSNDSSPDVLRLSNEEAEKLVRNSVQHCGFYEISDTSDDCADILTDLDEIEKLEDVTTNGNVWWQYVFSFDSHFGNHMRNLEAQSEWIQKNVTEGNTIDQSTESSKMQKSIFILTWILNSVSTLQMLLCYSGHVLLYLVLQPLNSNHDTPLPLFLATNIGFSLSILIASILIFTLQCIFRKRTYLWLFISIFHLFITVVFAWILVSAASLIRISGSP